MLQAFQHQRRRAFGHDETVAILGEGPRGLGRVVIGGGERREQREADQRLGCTEPSVPSARAASHSPRRIASTPNWIAVAPEAQAVESEMGWPARTKAIGQRIGNRAEQKALVPGADLPVAAASSRS